MDGRVGVVDVIESFTVPEAVHTDPVVWVIIRIPDRIRIVNHHVYLLCGAKSQPHTHVYVIVTDIFPGEGGSAGCPLVFLLQKPSIFIFYDIITQL